MDSPLLDVRQVFKNYRDGARTVEALRGVDLRIDEAGFYAVMGPSGSGKSTLLHLVAGLDRADKGQVMVGEDDLGQLGEGRLTDFRRRRLGIVFQRFNLIPTLTAQQNIALPGLLDRRPRKWIDERVRELLRQVGLQDRATHRPDALSGGEQQRVAVARALLFAPTLLLADEPTGSLDSASSERFFSMLEELARAQRMIVLMVTHEPAAAMRCRRVYVLKDGQCRGSFEVNGLDAGGVASRYRDLSR